MPGVTVTGAELTDCCVAREAGIDICERKADGYLIDFPTVLSQLSATDAFRFKYFGLMSLWKCLMLPRFNSLYPQD